MEHDLFPTDRIKLKFMNQNTFHKECLLHLAASLSTLQGNKLKYYTNPNDTHLWQGNMWCQFVNRLLCAIEL